ncbi:MAG: hypothetical protein ACYDBY_02885 [Thermoanaerobaculia bacterium]
MRSVISFGAIGLAMSLAVLPASPAFGQEATTSTKKTTTTAPDGSTRTTTKTTTVEGKVVRYERGKTIVVMEPGDREATFVLAPDATVPEDIEVGRYVSLSTENSASGPMTVTRVTTHSVTPEGNLKTETSAKGTTPAGNEVSSTTTTTVTGTVKSVQSGRSMTLVLPNRSSVEYSFDDSSVVPAELAIGNTVTVVTTRTTAGAPLVAKKVTITTRKTTTKTTTAKRS